MSEVTSSIEEPIVRVSQIDMKYRQPRSTLPTGMVWLTILAGMVVLGACEDSAIELNGMASVEQMTTDTPPPREAVTDLYSVPLAAFKVQLPPSSQLTKGDEAELLGLPLGKAENNTDASPTPPFSNLWFNAGQSLGSAANSLTGWLNNRLIPQTTTTTTKPPELIVRVQKQNAKKKPLISIESADGNRRKTQANRIGPEAFDTDDDDLDDDEEDSDDEDEYDDAEEEQVGEVDEEEDNIANVYEDEGEEDEEEEEEVRPVKKRRGNTRKQTRRRRPSNSRRGYEYEEEEDGEYDDDDDYEYDLANQNIGRQQQQQSLFTRFRQLAKIPYSSGNKQPNGDIQSQIPGYRPVRIVQNGQVLQLIEDRPSNQKQVNRRRRPVQNSDTSFQLIPIQNNQAANGGQKQKRKNINRPDQANQFIIPIPQSSQNNQKRPSQFITIPWSQLGISNPEKDSQQAAPIIVNIPQYALQQNSNRRKRPAQKPSQATPQRKRLPLNNGQVISLLSDQNVRDIFRVPEIPPSRTPQRPVAQSDNATTNKPATSPQPEAEAEDDEDENHSQQEPYIVVGDDDTEDEPLPRHAMPKRFLHFGGMKPYADVLNNGKIYFKSGRLLRMDLDERPDSEIISVNSQHTEHITTESLSETKANAPPTISTDDISTTGNPLSR